MDDLVQFLRDRLDEDERIARAACEGGGGRWHALGDRIGGSVAGDHEGYHVACDEGYPTLEQATHIATHDPARVLLDIEAKRRVLECHEPWTASNGDTICGRCGREHIDGRPGAHFPCQTLRLLASVHADHPDYREEWKP